MRQNDVHRVRNHANMSRMRTLYKNIGKWIESGDGEKAESFFKEAQKSIDTCAKKNLIHKNNAARKKSRIANLISGWKAKASQNSEEKKA